MKRRLWGTALVLLMAGSWRGVEGYRKGRLDAALFSAAARCDAAEKCAVAREEANPNARAIRRDGRP